MGQRFYTIRRLESPKKRRRKANAYKLCGCSQCRWHRFKFRKEISQSCVRRIRKINRGRVGAKQPRYGLYTD